MPIKSYKILHGPYWFRYLQIPIFIKWCKIVYGPCIFWCLQITIFMQSYRILYDPSRIWYLQIPNFTKSYKILYGHYRFWYLQIDSSWSQRFCFMALLRIWRGRRSHSAVWNCGFDRSRASTNMCSIMSFFLYTNPWSKQYTIFKSRQKSTFRWRSSLPTHEQPSKVLHDP